jgi:hypothetical protein
MYAARGSLDGERVEVVRLRRSQGIREPEAQAIRDLYILEQVARGRRQRWIAARLGMTQPAVSQRVAADYPESFRTELPKLIRHHPGVLPDDLMDRLVAGLIEWRMKRREARKKDSAADRCESRPVA